MSGTKLDYCIIIEHYPALVVTTDFVSFVLLPEQTLLVCTHEVLRKDSILETHSASVQASMLSGTLLQLFLDPVDGVINRDYLRPRFIKCQRAAAR